MMAAIKNVAVLGASGHLGKVIVPALLSANFAVTIITRPDSKSKVSFPGSTTRTANYGDFTALKTAFADQQAVVEAFNPAAATHQRTIARAAIAAGVSHLLTPDFSSDTFCPHASELHIFDHKIAAQRELESAIEETGGKLSWTAIIVGSWYDWAIEVGLFWIDKGSKIVTRFGSGDQKYSMSRLGLCGDATVAVLRAPEKFRNRAAYFASHTISTNQLIKVLGEMYGEGVWKVADVPVGDLRATGLEMWDVDTKNGVVDRLNSKAYATLGTAALFDEGNRYNADFGDMLEPGWDEGMERLKENFRKQLG